MQIRVSPYYNLMKQKVKAQVSFLDHSLSGIHRSVCLSVSVSLNKILSKKIIVPWDQLAEFWRFVYAYMYKNEREMFEYTWLNLPRLRLETYARFYQQRNFAWLLFKIEKKGGGYCHLGTDEHTCTWIEKCVNVFYIEDLNYFFLV